MNRFVIGALLTLITTSVPGWSQVLLQADNASSRPVQVAAATTAQRKYALHELDAGGIMLDAKVKSAYYKALGPLSKEPWLAELDGPTPPNEQVKVAGADYVLMVSCKNHACDDHNVVLLYSPSRRVMYGKVYQEGKSTLLGSPPPAIAAELERLWQAVWRQGK